MPPSRRRSLPRLRGLCARDLRQQQVSSAAGLLCSFDRRGNQLAFVDLAQCDRQRLFVQLGVNQWADVFEQALVQLGVVSVDLTSALGTEDHQAVLGISY